MATRGPGFSEEEVASLLDVINDILPNSPNDWERVTEAHLNLFPDLKRNTKSLKRKFESLYNHRKPTGDPTCPVSVRRAKQIWEEIKTGMDFSDAEGELVFDASVAPQVNDEEAAGTAPTAAPEASAPEGVEQQLALAAASTTAQAPPSAATATSVFVRESPSVIGQRFRSPRKQQSQAIPTTMTSDLIQFMMLRAELEDKRRNEREEREERRARQREEAEERRRADEAEERRERSAMMQMLMMGMFEGQRKRKRSESEEHKRVDE